jgi:hypothetical protein
MPYFRAVCSSRSTWRGTPSSVAWIEWFVAPPSGTEPPYINIHEINVLTVKPGETVSFWVRYIQGWQPWLPIWGDTMMDPGAPVTALWRPNDQHLDLFATNARGIVLSTWWEFETSWATDWFPIWEGTPMRPGATVTAVWRPNDTHLDLFATDSAGTVWTTWWEPSTGWGTPWVSIWSQTTMQPGATVTAVWRPNDTHLDLFATDGTGTVQSTWWEPTTGWSTPWVSIWSQTTMQPGATVTAVWRPNDTHLDLFASDGTGTVQSTWWEPTPGWGTPWVPVWSQTMMQPGATVTAVWRPNDTHLDLFATDGTGTVQSTWWEPSTGWGTAWFSIWSQLKKMQAGATVTALWQPFYEHLDLFVTARRGVVWSAWWVADNGGGVVSFFDHANGKHGTFVMERPPGAIATGATAEWIMEDPNGGEPFVSLANFTPVTFTDAVCFGPNNTTGNPGDSNAELESIVLTEPNGTNVTLTSVTAGTNTLTIEYIGG